MRSEAELKSSLENSNKFKRDLNLYLYFGICFAAVCLGMLSNPESTIIFNLLNPIQTIFSVAIGLVGLGIAYVLIFRLKDYAVKFEIGFAGVFFKWFLFLCSFLTLFASSKALVKDVNIFYAVKNSTSVISGPIEDYSIVDRKIKFKMNNKEYLINCDDGCNFSAAMKRPEYLNVYITNNAKIYKIEKYK